MGSALITINEIYQPIKSLHFISISHILITCPQLHTTFPALYALFCNLGLHSSLVRGKRSSSKMPIFRVETKLAYASPAHCILLLGIIKPGIKDREKSRGTGSQVCRKSRVERIRVPDLV